MKPRRHRTPREQRDALRIAREKRWRRQQRNLVVLHRQLHREVSESVWPERYGAESFDLLGAHAVG